MDRAHDEVASSSLDEFGDPLADVIARPGHRDAVDHRTDVLPIGGTEEGGGASPGRRRVGVHSHHQVGVPAKAVEGSSVLTCDIGDPSHGRGVA